MSREQASEAASEHRRAVAVLVGEQMRRARTHAKLSQSKAARRIGVKPVRLGAWERAEAQCPYEHLVALSLLYFCSIDYFFETAKDAQWIGRVG